jgi:hypothetical protein
VDIPAATAIARQAERCFERFRPGLSQSVLEERGLAVHERVVEAKIDRGIGRHQAIEYRTPYWEWILDWWNQIAPSRSRFGGGLNCASADCRNGDGEF